jgi:chromate transporter
MLRLFFIFFRIGLFSIGGGYAMIPLIQQDLVGAGYMTLTQVTDLVAISQITPGPIAVNAATFAGMHTMGVAGAVVATLGVVLPCALISVVVARFFFSRMDSALVQGALYGMRPVVVSLIAGAMLTFAASSLLMPGGGLEAGAAVIFAGVFTLALVKETSPAVLFLLSALAGLAFYAP